MFEELFSGYLSPYLCLQNLFEQEVLRNFWTCCVYWKSYDIVMNYAEDKCGPESVEKVSSSMHIAFPGIREECPGFGSLTCTQWFIIPIVLCVIGVVAVLLLLGWTTFVSYKYVCMRRRDRRYKMDAEEKGSNRGGHCEQLLNMKTDPAKCQQVDLTRGLSYRNDDNNNIS